MARSAVGLITVILAAQLVAPAPAQEPVLSAEEIREALTPAVAPSDLGVLLGDAGSPDTPLVQLPIQFGLDSTELLPASFAQLIELGRALSGDLSGYRFRIEGHTCSIGGSEYNLNLSQRRAEKVQQLLVEEFGLAWKQFDLEGAGEGQPVASNSTEEGRMRNRRVVVANLNQKFYRAGEKKPY